MLKPIERTVQLAQEPSDGERYRSVITAHGQALRARSQWLTGNRADADDLLQDTIERSMRSRRHVVGDEDMRRWLLVIMHNAFLDARRSAAVRRLAFNSETHIEGLCQPDQTDVPLWRRVDDEMLLHCVAQLPPQAAKMIRMTLQGASYQEIGARFDIPLRTVGTRLHRIRKRLRALLGAALSASDCAPTNP